MPYVQQLATEKAYIINRNKKVYGTFSEIGAGQEVVHHFFKAGLASQTVAKSMSAYDMIFSDTIYGKSQRYVCKERLVQMLNHEYKLIEKRLKKQRGAHTCFFSFANTVKVHTSKQESSNISEGWMGIRFQHKPSSTPSQILLHIDLMDKTRLQQYELLGVLGVNLIYASFYNKRSPQSFINSLVDNFEKIRVQIDVIHCQGPAFTKWNDTQISLELLKKNLTNVVAFSPKPIALQDIIYEKPMFVFKAGAFSQSQLKSHLAFLKRKVKSSFTPLQICHIKKPHSTCILHNFKNQYDLKLTLRRYTQKEIVFHMKIKELLSALAEKSSSQSLALEFLTHFFDKKTKIFINQSKAEILSQSSSDIIKLLVSKKYIICKR